MSVSIERLTPPLPVPGTPDGDALDALEAATQERPLPLAGVLAEAASDVDGVALVARDGGAVVGMASGRMLAGEAHVVRLAVAQERRRRGIGRALLDGLIAWSRDRAAGAVLLEVRASNVAAQALYATRGFVPEGTRPGYYPGGEDAQLWRLDLDGALDDDPDGEG